MRRGSAIKFSVLVLILLLLGCRERTPEWECVGREYSALDFLNGRDPYFYRNLTSLLLEDLKSSNVRKDLEVVRISAIGGWSGFRSLTLAFDPEQKKILYSARGNVYGKEYESQGIKHSQEHVWISVKDAFSALGLDQCSKIKLSDVSAPDGLRLLVEYLGSDSPRFLYSNAFFLNEEQTDIDYSGMSPFLEILNLWGNETGGAEGD